MAPVKREHKNLYNHKRVTIKRHIIKNEKLFYEVIDDCNKKYILNGYEITVTNTALDPMIYEYKYVIEDLTNQLLILKQTVTEPGGTSINRIYLTRN
jgi:hypothetical protein